MADVQQKTEGAQKVKPAGEKLAQQKPTGEKFAQQKPTGEQFTGEMGDVGKTAPKGQVDPACPSRMNFDSNCEKLFNEHLQLELHAAYSAQSMWAFYSRDCKGCVGMSRLAEWASMASLQRGRRIAAYIIYRGGHPEYRELPAPKNSSWDSPKEAFEHCIANKKKIYASLQSLRNCCDTTDGSCSNDAHCTNFIENELMDEVVAWCKFLSDCLANLNCIGDQGLGAWVFDRWLARIVMSKFCPPKIPTLSTKNIENNLPNELFDAEGDLMGMIGKLRV